MPFPAPILQPKALYVPPAIMRNIPREDVLWNRPVFKAPPLVVTIVAGKLPRTGSDPRLFGVADQD